MDSRRLAGRRGVTATTFKLWDDLRGEGGVSRARKTLSALADAAGVAACPPRPGLSGETSDGVGGQAGVWIGIPMRMCYSSSLPA